MQNILQRGNVLPVLGIESNIYMHFVLSDNGVSDYEELCIYLINTVHSKYVSAEKIHCNDFIVGTPIIVNHTEN